MKAPATTFPGTGGYRLRARVAVFAAALALLTALASPLPAEAKVKAVSPKIAITAERIHIAATAPGATSQVAFYVDGRRWVDTSPRWQFGRTGYVPTTQLGVGEHRLVVEARQSSGRVFRAKRLIRIRRSTAKGKGPKSTSTEPAPEPTPTPAPEPAPEPTPPPQQTPTTEPAPEPTPEPTPTPTPEPTSTPAPQPTPSGSLLFHGDFDSGFKGWYVQSLSTRASLFSPAYEGSQAARFEVRDGDVEPDTGAERSEVSGPTFDEGQDIYIRDAIRVAGSNNYQGPWQIVQQLHEENWSGSPGLAVFLDSANVLTLGAGDGSPTFWNSAKLQRDRWYDLVYRVKLSRSSSTGFVEVWLDGVQQTLLNGQARAYGQTMQAAQTYLKAGIYRSKSSTGTSLVEHDAILVGTSLAAVTAG